MLNARVAAAAPFAVLATLAIIAAGVVAAAIAYDPTQQLIWMVAYLVLVVGVMQWACGAGQAWLARQPPGRAVVWSQWGLFNVGSACVIGGTLINRTGVVAAGVVLFVLAMAGFFLGVRRSRHRGWSITYHVLLALICLSACIGLVISAASHGRA